MFWKKNKSSTTPTTCNANSNTPECNGIANLREYQRQLKLIENLDLRGLCEQYVCTDRNMYRSEETCHVIYDLIRSKRSLNFEEHFRQFGKELDDFIQRDNLIKELNYYIKIEKEKLGIE